MPKEKLTVLIVGGSISGLVLAHALAHQDIQCIILESRTDILANAGATLTILPNGARILDQLGLLGEVTNEAAPMLVHRTWLEGGLLLSSVDMTRFPSRSGYGFFVIERRALLSVLLRNAPAKVGLGKKVVRIDSGKSRVTAHCADGTFYTGDVVVGADGIHSVTHGEMYRNMALPRPVCITTSYSGIFGTSTCIPGMKKGIAHRVYGHLFSFIVTVGKDERVHWYLAIRRTTQRLTRYVQKEIDKCIQPYLSVKIADGVYFDQIYRNRISCCHVPLEEGLQTRWAWERFACIGDAAHKMTPNIAQGANCAIETAASLANHLSRIDKTDLNLGSWSQPRQRLVWLYWASHVLIRVEASAWWLARWIGWYIGFFHGALVMDTLAGISPYTIRVDYLPVGRVDAVRTVWIHAIGQLGVILFVWLYGAVQRL